MDNKCKEITFRVPLLGLAKYGSLNSYDNIYFCRFMIQIVHGWFYMCMCSLSFLFPNGSVFPYLLTDLTCNTKFWGATKSSSLYPSLTAKLKSVPLPVALVFIHIQTFTAVRLGIPCVMITKSFLLLYGNNKE